MIRGGQPGNAEVAILADPEGPVLDPAVDTRAAGPALNTIATSNAHAARTAARLAGSYSASRARAANTSDPPRIRPGTGGLW